MRMTTKSSVNQLQAQFISPMFDRFILYKFAVTVVYGGLMEGLRPVKNWCMLSLKFPRQKIVKGDFLKRDGDFRAWVVGSVTFFVGVNFFPHYRTRFLKTFRL